MWPATDRRGCCRRCWLYGAWLVSMPCYLKLLVGQGHPAQQGKQGQLGWRVGRHAGTPSKTTTKDTMSVGTPLYIFSPCQLSVFHVEKTAVMMHSRLCSYRSSRRARHESVAWLGVTRKSLARSVSGGKTNNRRPQTTKVRSRSRRRRYDWTCA